MECPTCKATLQTASHEGVGVDRCPVGHGVWLDPGEIARIVDRRDAPRPADELQAAVGRGAHTGEAGEISAATRPCPVCGALMERRVYDEISGVLIDVCEHGLWFDERELERVEAWMEASEQQLSPLSERNRHEVAAVERLDAALTERRPQGFFRRFLSSVDADPD